jgi:hypothetical protein
MPYKSAAKRGKFHILEKEGKISRKVVNEFDKASKGMKLPEHDSKSKHGYAKQGKHYTA